MAQNQQAHTRVVDTQERRQLDMQDVLVMKAIACLTKAQSLNPDHGRTAKVLENACRLKERMIEEDPRRSVTNLRMDGRPPDIPGHTFAITGSGIAAGTSRICAAAKLGSQVHPHLPSSQHVQNTYLKYGNSHTTL